MPCQSLLALLTLADARGSETQSTGAALRRALSEGHADEEPDFVQIRADGGIAYAKIAIGPMGEAEFRVERELREFESQATSGDKTEGAPVSKFGNLAAVETIELFAERTSPARGRSADVKDTVEGNARSHERMCGRTEPIDDRNRRLPSPRMAAPGSDGRDCEAGAAQQKVRC